MGQQISYNYDPYLPENFDNNNNFFINFIKLINDIIKYGDYHVHNQIQSQRLLKKIELYSSVHIHIKVLLRNILILLGIQLPLFFKEFEDVKEVDETKLKKKIVDKDKFTAFADTFWMCSLHQLMYEYDKFKNTRPVTNRQSYFLFWINIINISQILVRIIFDPILNDYYYKNKSEVFTDRCKFQLVVQNLIKALNCKYDNILQLYMSFLQFIMCINEKEEKSITNLKDGFNTLFNSPKFPKNCAFEFGKILTHNMENNNDVFYLLSGNHFPSYKYGRFEGTKFYVSIINPYFKAHDAYNILGTVIHDECAHKSYSRKFQLTEENEKEFKILIKIIERNKLPISEIAEEILLSEKHRMQQILQEGNELEKEYAQKILELPDLPNMMSSDRLLEISHELYHEKAVFLPTPSFKLKYFILTVFQGLIKTYSVEFVEYALKCWPDPYFKSTLKVLFLNILKNEKLIDQTLFMQLLEKVYIFDKYYVIYQKFKTTDKIKNEKINDYFKSFNSNYLIYQEELKSYLPELERKINEKYF